jgi:hypothetical protein
MGEKAGVAMLGSPNLAPDSLPLGDAPSFKRLKNPSQKRILLSDFLSQTLSLDAVRVSLDKSLCAGPRHHGRAPQCRDGLNVLDWPIVYLE